MIKKLFIFSFVSAFLISLLIAGSDFLISQKTADCYSSVNDVPHKKVGLVLGANKFLRSGRKNLFYTYRVDAAVKLFKAGKVEYLLVSGDNSRKEYDEPTTFKEDLEARGVPANRIVLDFAGFRTLDSIERCKAVFGEKDIVVISQPFHNERALFLADKKGLNAVAFNAKSITVTYKYGLRTMIREKLARVKCVLDVYILNTKPKFYGDKIKIG